MIRATLHRYSVYAFVLRSLKVANMMIEAALFNARQTGLDKEQAVQEKLALLACYREGINAHLAAAIAMGRAEPGRPLDAEPIAALYGRVLASSQLNPMMRVCRELCGGQICVTPDFAAFQDPETAPWLEKYYTINEDWRSEDRRRRLAFARPAQLQLRRSPADLPALRAIAAFLPTSPRFTGNFDWDAPLRFVHKSAGLSDRVLADIGALRSRTTGAWHKS